MHRLSIRRFAYYFLSLAVLAVFCSSCEIDTRVTVTSNNPPRFDLFGSGSLAGLRIEGQKVRESPAIFASVVWEIRPKDGRENSQPLAALGSITYGNVPAGYVQVFPEAGNAPPLLEGQKYHAWFETINANGARVDFTVREGKVLELSE